MNIAIWNQSRLDNPTVQLIADACDLQMSEDVAPAYRLRQPPRVLFFPSTAKDADLPKDCLVLVFSENLESTSQSLAARIPPEATILDADGSGRRYGRVYVENIINEGGKTLDGPRSISSATSHECVEHACDESGRLWVWSDHQLVAYEVCDMVEEECYTKKIGDTEVSVSNFVYPEWFDPMPPEGSRFDHLGSVDAPFTCTPGGYKIVFDPNDSERKIKTDPPQTGSWWSAMEKERGFARTRVRLAW